MKKLSYTITVIIIAVAVIRNCIGDDTVASAEVEGNAPTSPAAAEGNAPTSPSEVEGNPPTLPATVEGNAPTLPATVEGNPPTLPATVEGNPPTLPATVEGNAPTAPAEVEGNPPTLPATVEGNAPTSPSAQAEIDDNAPTTEGDQTEDNAATSSSAIPKDIDVNSEQESLTILSELDKSDNDKSQVDEKSGAEDDQNSKETENSSSDSGEAGEQHYLLNVTRTNNGDGQESEVSISTGVVQAANNDSSITVGVPLVTEATKNDEATDKTEDNDDDYDEDDDSHDAALDLNVSQSNEMQPGISAEGAEDASHTAAAVTTASITTSAVTIADVTTSTAASDSIDNVEVTSTQISLIGKPLDSNVPEFKPEIHETNSDFDNKTTSSMSKEFEQPATVPTHSEVFDSQTDISVTGEKYDDVYVDKDNAKIEIEQTTLVTEVVNIANTTIDTDLHSIEDTGEELRSHVEHGYESSKINDVTSTQFTEAYTTVDDEDVELLSSRAQIDVSTQTSNQTTAMLTVGPKTDSDKPASVITRKKPTNNNKKPKIEDRHVVRIKFSRNLSEEERRIFAQLIVDSWNKRNSKKSTRSPVKDNDLEKTRSVQKRDTEHLISGTSPDTDPLVVDDVIFEQDEEEIYVSLKSSDGSGYIPNEVVMNFIEEIRDDVESKLEIGITDMQRGRATKASASSEPPSLWDMHQGIFISLIVLASVSLLVLLAYCFRCARQSYDVDKTLMTAEEGRVTAKHPVVMSSPFSDAELVQEETPKKYAQPNIYTSPPSRNGMKERDNPAVTVNGGGQHLSRLEEEFEYGIVPLDNLTNSERNLTEVENTRF